MERKHGYTFLYTVKDLKEYLKNVDDDMKLVSCDADIGGYDVITHHFINPTKHKNYLYLGHEECNAYEKYSRKEITFSEFEEMFPTED